MDKPAIVGAIVLQRRRTLELLRSLQPARFELPTALPGWRIREVVAHLVATDAATVTGRILPVVLRGSTDVIERWNERQVARWADRPAPELLFALERWGRRFAALARALPAPLYRAPLPTLWGRGPGGLLVWSRVYDEWVHRQDVRRALGMEDEAADLESVADFLFHALSLEFRRWPAGPGGSVSVSLDGVSVPTWRFDLKRRRSEPASAAGEDARLEAPGPAFVMMAAGRDRAENLRSRGLLRIEGDQNAASWFLEHLRIV